MIASFPGLCRCRMYGGALHRVEPPFYSHDTRIVFELHVNRDGRSATPGKLRNQIIDPVANPRQFPAPLMRKPLTQSGAVVESGPLDRCCLRKSAMKRQPCLP